MTDNGDGTFTFTNNDGSDVTIDISALETNTIIQDTLTSGGNLIATYINEDSIRHGIYETITSLVDNADGTITYTPEDGPAVTVAKADLTDNGDCLLYTSPSPRDQRGSRMPSSA